MTYWNNNAADYYLNDVISHKAAAAAADVEQQNTEAPQTINICTAVSSLHFKCAVWRI